MPGAANAIQAGINKLNEQLRNEQNPVEIEKLKAAIEKLKEQLKEITGG